MAYNKEFIITDDGSSSIYLPTLNTAYHSTKGALQESKHVFINAGFKYILSLQTFKDLAILEMGFGTGLNAFLTAIEAEKCRQKVYYQSIELYPLQENEVQQLNYGTLLDNTILFNTIHNCIWDNDVLITNFFTLHKTKSSLLNTNISHSFNLIYFDAFAPNLQPELWTVAVFKLLFNLLKPNGILVTFCSKGSVRRNLETAGFLVEKIAGPIGKTEMIRAIKKMEE